ncbi:MAG: CHAT domain-containing protein [Acidobacteriota bacterium]|nr:CHAT domain-containing protein [Acidobacteriota bacterium]
MEIAYQDFSLWIEPLDSAPGYRLKAHSPAGEACETIRLADAAPPSHPPLDPTQAAAAGAFSLAAGQGPDLDNRRRGEELFRLLFCGRIGRLFASSTGPLPDPERGLRIKLYFDPSQPSAAALCALPWELLYNAETKDYLGINPLTPVVRYLEVPRPHQLPPFEPPLRLLIVASNPGLSAPLGLARERRLIEQTLMRDPEVEITVLEHCDRESLVDAIGGAPFDVLHFMGHAGFDEATGTGTLLLDGPDGRVEPLPGDLLAHLLKGSLPRLVVLNACNSARACSGRGSDFFSGLATAVVMGGVPAVVAMRAPVSDLVAVRFSQVLYRQLARGEAVEAAVSEGRRALFLAAADAPEWSTPVLFMRVPDGRLFAARAAEPDLDAPDGGGVARTDEVVVSVDGLETGNDAQIVGMESTRASAPMPRAVHVSVKNAQAKDGFKICGLKSSN